ncbi:protein kinase C substrate protein [Trypanosoma grayi]|uniref:protein kinase C substrate protein n=1 Tax=Trypanosoma grayi TaxID=71804 RepID=UPI0004F4B68A|nr:protein kinase C substrate protein [Trypanosoma grayi]KEG06321.1 protein kinase C substrate protein [Trypanosoma grayi]
MLLPVLFIVALVVPVSSAVQPLYGVQRSLLRHFEVVKHDDIFKCLSGNVAIKGHQVNDDYCDCPDGSDEPGTSACTHYGTKANFPPDWMFTCKNAGFKPQEIPHNRINDGICDCCDGSDEYSGISQCPNVCAEFYEREEKRIKEEESIRQAGIAAKQDMIAKAVRNREDTKSRLNGEIPELEEKKKIIEEITMKLAPLEEKEKEEKQRLRVAYDVAHEAWKRERENNATKTPTNSSLKCLKWRTTRVCDVEEGSGGDDRDCNDLIAGEEEGVCECFNEELNSTVAYEKACDHSMLQCSFVCASGGKDGVSSDNNEENFDMEDGSSYELPEARDLRREVQNIRERINELTSSIEKAQKELNRTINAEDIVKALEGECFTVDFMSYTYELCPFKDTHQYNKGTKSGPCMGRWGRFAESTYSLWASTSDYTHMIFENGDRCWNGVHRSTDVHVVCGSENKLVQAEEPSMCHYNMVFQTPAVCE